MWRIRLILFLLFIGPTLGSDFNLLIRDARVVDGTGTPWFRADVGIRGDTIVAVGNLASKSAELTIDAAGLIVTPGFIDVHTHVEGEDRGIERLPGAENFLRDGVTTIVTGNCGGSVIDVAEWFSQLEKLGISLNLATLIGHNSVREEVMGRANRQASADELKAMQGLVEQAMRDGAVGFSTGLLYVPGTYANTAEVVALAKVAARFGGIYASHIREQGAKLHDSVREAVQVGEEAGLPVQISHFKVKGRNRWGTIGSALQLLDDFRARGVDVAIDAYPYDQASTNLGVNLPSWALADGSEALAGRLSDPPTKERIIREMKAMLQDGGYGDYSFATIANYRARPEWAGKTIAEVNRELGRPDTVDSQIETILDMRAQGGAQMIYHYMSLDDVRTVYRYPYTAVASDGGVQKPSNTKPHPRSYGTNARVLAQFVREEKLLRLEEAVRRMTSLPAGRFGFWGRGLIRPGMKADLLIFDPEQVRDEATYADPHRYSQGMKYVLVNGHLAISKGKASQERYGQVLRHVGTRRSAIGD